jgi:hypothetical protein
MTVAPAAQLATERRRESVRLILGYVVWGLTGAAIAFPEIWAAVDSDSVPWPTISGTVGYIEYWHDWVAVIVIGVLVWGAFYALRRSRSQEEERRTPAGRFTLREPKREPIQTVGAILYYAFALGAVIAGPLIVLEVRPHDKYLLGEVLYGLIGFFGILVPSAVALLYGKDIPFTTLFATLQHLEEKVRLLAIVVAAGIVVLLLHLALYPWPSVIPNLQDLHKQYEKQRHEQLKQKEPSPYSP